MEHAAVIDRVRFHISVAIPVYSFCSEVDFRLIACFFRVEIFRTSIQRAEAAGAAKLRPLIPKVFAGSGEAEASHHFVRLNIVSKQVPGTKLRAVAALVAGRFPNAMLRLFR